MIVGNGLLAHTFAPRFADDSETIVFASGVSHSAETRASEFERERAMLLDVLQRGTRQVIYFGSCGVTSPASELTPYMRHKQMMEALVLALPGNRVFRLPQVVSHTDNPSTLTNFIYNRIMSGEHFTVWAHAERNLIDIADVCAIATALIEDDDSPRVVSIAARQSLLAPEIVSIFEETLGRKANCSVVPKGSPLLIDSTTTMKVSTRLGIDLGDTYIPGVIRKYYSPDASARLRAEQAKEARR
ncbi:NAD-dependent epimerase/dehydratase family protein [Frateuria soli]|uniref:NAD-dependent epimerase/dehydratase family protein n=1 Tax=Frateuria soli TaxID=1542730 RepID=UPI001E5D0E79|nr:NAD-dependent epimerase/dehydratase family protein [Frateuria soli]UGB37558.1 hypothetical protein LQ771_12085 [Frateuria soli]